MQEEKDIPEYSPPRSPSSGSIRLIVIFLSIVIFFLLAYLLKGILTSLLLAFTVAYIFDPVVDFIESRQVILPNLRVPRGMAVAILIIYILIVGSVFLSYTIPKTVESAKRVARVLGREYPHYQKQIESFLGEYGPPELAAFFKTDEVAPGNDLGVTTTLKKETGPLDIVMHLKEYFPGAAQYMFDIIKKFFYSTFGLVGTMANLFTFTLVSIYLLKDYDRIIKELKTLIPSSRKDRALELIAKVDNNLRAFLRGQLTVSMVLGLFYSVGLSLVGVPMAFLVGFLAGIGNMVPLLGTFIGIVLAMSLTALEHAGELWPFAFVGITFAIGQFLDSTVLTPNIVGSRVGLHPVVIILSVLIWSQLLGFLGMLMAIPFTTAAMVFLGEAIGKYKESIDRQ
ncbi:MAG TPA: AI-2E family transporter [Candidatus Hypogeohydataceae bacterium YC41]